MVKKKRKMRRRMRLKINLKIDIFFTYLMKMKSNLYINELKHHNSLPFLPLFLADFLFFLALEFLN